MKSRLMVVLVLVVGVLEGKGQVRYFNTDTLGFKTDSVSGDTTWVRGETWVVQKASRLKDTLTFTKNDSHKPKLEFDETGVCYIELGWTGMEYGMDFLFHYKIIGNKLIITDSDNKITNDFIGEFSIVKYSKYKMVLLRLKK